MNNIVFDFRHNYVRGERLPSEELVYQYDAGRVVEAYVPEQESSFFLHVGFENDPTLSVIEVDSVTADQDEGGYKILATIPDSILTRYGTLLVYVVAAGNDQLVTTYEGQVPVNNKAVAEDYIVPDEQATNIIERAAAAADRAEAAAETAMSVPTIAQTAAEMTDTSKLYVYVGTETGYNANHWYYYNGSAWVDGGTYEVTALTTDKTLTRTDFAADAKVVGDEIADLKSDLDNKADIDGTYEELTAGNAEQLISSKMTEDKVPYLYRTSGGSIDIGDREYDTIVGGTVAWNQLIIPSILANGNANGIEVVADTETGEINVSGTATANASISLVAGSPFALEINHVYCLAQPVGASANTFFIRSGEDTFWNFKSIGKIVNKAVTNMRLFVLSGQTVNFKFKPQLFDLTTMFGSTIADYIYNLEQTTAGAGVAWFRKLFPKDYYEYCEPTLKSVEGLTSHDMVGFNQWDEEWESGYYDTTTGEKASSATWQRNKNKVRCLPNTAYHFKQEPSGGSFGYILFFDADNSFISYINGSATSSTGLTFTTPPNAHYFAFYRNAPINNGKWLCINLSWSGTHNGEYQPHVKHSYPLDSSLTLRGIPKLDSNNQMYYDGDTYEADGTVTRKYGIVDLGTLNWSEYSGYPGLFYTNVTEIPFKVPASNVTTPNAVMAHYQAFISRDIGKTGYTKGYFALANNRIYIADDTYGGDTASFNAAMSGTMLIYELATPTTETANPYTSPQIVDDWGTEEYVTDSIVPVGHVTEYPQNLRDKLQHLPDLADSDGYYVIQQTNSEMTLTHFRIPQAPTTNGTYILKATVSGGTPTYTWVAEE